MKHLFLVSCVCLLISVVAHAQELLRCVDRHGNAVITTAPQEGMKCKKGEDDELSSRRSRRSNSTNLVDICSDLNRELEELNDDVTALERRRTELQREQLENRPYESQDYSSYRRRSSRLSPEAEKMNKLSREMSLLQQKRSLVYQDIRSYKCNELNNDLSRINNEKRSAPITTTGGRYRNR